MICNIQTMQVIPDLFKCATYPITSLIDMFWANHVQQVKDGSLIDPCTIEMVSMLERALNYGHTGNAAVFCKKLMDRSWLSLGLLNDGFPSLSDSFIAHGSLSTGQLTVRTDGWPIEARTCRPLTSSKRSQQLTYGNDSYEVRRSNHPTCISFKHQITMNLLLLLLLLVMKIMHSIIHIDNLPRMAVIIFHP